MKKFMCIQHKGGVGKTIIAIHMAGAIAAQRGKKIFMDCDSQQDLSKFFLGERKLAEKIRRIPIGSIEDATLIINEERDNLRSSIANSDFVVVDIDARVANAGQIFNEITPDCVFVPIKEYDYTSLEHMISTLTFLNLALKGIGVKPQKIVVLPVAFHLGSDEGESELAAFKNAFDEAKGKLSNEPIFGVLEFASPLKFSKFAGKCVVEGKYLWEFSDEIPRSFFSKYLEEV